MAASAAVILTSYPELLGRKQLWFQLPQHEQDVAPRGRTELGNKGEHEKKGSEMSWLSI